MVPTPNLPTDKGDLARVITQHADAEESRVELPWRVRWAMFEAYLAGFRRFDALDTRGNRVDSYFLDKNGRWQAQCHDILVEINRIRGVIDSADYWPQIERKTNSLSAQRDRASGQLIANALYSEEALKTRVSDASAVFCNLGTLGLFSRTSDTPNCGLCADIEVVHPAELLAYPSMSTSRVKQQGIIRSHFKPLDDLVAAFGTSIKKHLPKMEIFKRKFGDPEDPSRDPLYVQQRYNSPGGSSATGVTGTGDYLVVKVRELYTYGVHDTLRRYCAVSRNFTFEDIPYEDKGQLAHSPLQIARMIDTGGFYGMGLCDLMFSYTREYENIVGKLLDMVKGTDLYPVTLIPAGNINEKKLMKDGGEAGLRFATYTPQNSYMNGTQVVRPITINPDTKSFELLGRVSSMLHERTKVNSLLGDLLRDKGRADSGPAMQFLDEASKQPLTKPIQQFTSAFGRCHQYAVVEAASILLTSPRPVPVSAIDLSLVGAVIDFETNTVDFQSNPLPDPRMLRFTIRSASTQSDAVAKMEAMSYVQEGVITPHELKIYFATKGIEPAMWLGDYREPIRTLYQNILTVYNDGVTPKPIWVAPYCENSEVQITLLKAWMSGPDLRRASPRVINAFKLYLQTLMGFIGQVLPSGVPALDQLPLDMQEPQGMGPDLSQPQLAGTVGASSSPSDGAPE